MSLAGALETRIENPPSAAQDGLIWRGRRGGVPGAIVPIVVLAVLGVAAGARVVEQDAEIAGDGRGMEGHEGDDRRERRPWSRRDSARHRLRYRAGQRSKHGNISAPTLPVIARVTWPRRHALSPPSPDALDVDENEHHDVKHDFAVRSSFCPGGHRLITHPVTPSPILRSGGSSLAPFDTVGSPFVSTKEAQPEEDPSVSARLQRLQNNYEDFGMRRTVEGILVVHDHGHPHILMLQIANAFFKL